MERKTLETKVITQDGITITYQAVGERIVTSKMLVIEWTDESGNKVRKDAYPALEGDTKRATIDEQFKYAQSLKKFYKVAG